MFYAFLAGVGSQAILGLGLLLNAWLFRGVEPDRWRRMSARRSCNTVQGIIAITFTTSLFCLIQAGRVTLLTLFFLIVIPQLVGFLVMGTFWGRLKYAPGAGCQFDPEI
jgi:hypothetical protein